MNTNELTVKVADCVDFLAVQREEARFRIAQSFGHVALLVRARQLIHFPQTALVEVVDPFARLRGGGGASFMMMRVSILISSSSHPHLFDSSHPHLIFISSSPHPRLILTSSSPDPHPLLYFQSGSADGADPVDP